MSYDVPVPVPEPPGAASGVPLSGGVRRADGSAVPHAALTLIDTSGRQTGRGEADEEGRYALRAPRPGGYVLIVAAAGHQPEAVSVAVGARPTGIDVTLGSAARLTGRVRTTDGKPVQDAAVTLSDARGEVVGAARSGPDGGFVIDDVVAGEYTLAAGAPGCRPSALPVTVRGTGETRRDIELGGGSVLGGTVTAGEAGVVEDARVTLLDAAGNVVGTATTGADGVFRFAGLAPGEYTVIATGYPPVACLLRVGGGGRTERDLQLEHQE